MGYGYFEALAEIQTAEQRWRYRALIDDIPEGMYVRTTCSDPGCMNLRHMRLAISSLRSQIEANNPRRRRAA